MPEKKIAFVAIKRDRPRGGALIAHLPNTDIKLPSDWQWIKADGRVVTDDISAIAQGMSLEETCRLLCSHTNIIF